MKGELGGFYPLGERGGLYLDQGSAVPSGSLSDEPLDPRSAPQSSVLLMSYQCKIECSASVGGKVQRNADIRFGLM